MSINFTKNKINSYIGQKFNNLTITGNTVGKNNRVLTTTLCDCGVFKNFRLKDILDGKSTSCGCKTSEKLSLKSRGFTNLEDVVGIKINKLTAVKGYYQFNERIGSNEMKVDLLCDCGNIMINKSYSNFNKSL